MGSPALFSGNFVKFLKNKLNLFDAAYILTGTQDPRSVATDAPKGSILLRQTASGNGQVFFKLDAGSSTNWKLFSADTSTADSVFESIKNQLTDSYYNLVTTNIGGYDGSAKWTSITGAAFDPTTDSVKFTADAQVATSIQMLDANEFIANGIDVTNVDLSLYWSRSGAIPTGFTYEISRDGGTNWFTLAMTQVGSTNAFNGTIAFDTSTTTESVDQSLSTNAVNNSSWQLAGTTSGVAQKIVVPAGATWIVKSAAVTVTKNGTPVGNFTASIVRNNAGIPSILTTDVVCMGAAFSPNTLVAGSNAISLPDTILTPGTYWLVFQADSTYMAASGANNISFSADVVTGSGVARYISGAWTAFGATGSSLVHSLLGRSLDLRVRVTSAGSPSYPCYLDGYGVFYGTLNSATLSSVKKVQRFSFNSVTDNTSSFAITTFQPDVDLLSCFYVEAGQVFKAPAFELQGTTAVFPTNSFNNGGISATVTLIFAQPDGGSYDNADSNARLLTTNHLGSTSANDDRSVAGRGIYLRRPDGTLREIVLNDLDELEVWSV